MHHEMCMLNCVHDDFYATGLSAEDTTRDVVLGHLYGGTAILLARDRQHIC